MLILCLAGYVASASGQPPVQPLQLKAGYFVDGLENAQLSGLTVYGGELYTVSDKHDQWIYHIRIGKGAARLEKHWPTGIPVYKVFRRYDFEGITHDAKGNFYLASEADRRVLRVTKGGKNSGWVTPDLKPWGAAAGLFQVSNAYLEGIACIPPVNFLLCAERQPRGFLEVNASERPVQVKAYPSEQSRHPFAKGRSPDFSGLCRYNGTFYVLERNAYAVSRVHEVNGRFRAGEGWSYEHIETSQKYRYADMRYGKAEGLCIDADSVYMVLDNNNVARAAAAEDRRPLLLIFDRPAGLR
jgi:hypothetical protein